MTTLVPTDFARPAVSTAISVDAVAPPRASGRVGRAIFLLIALACAAAFFYAANTYWTGVHTGVDQNGYLVGGKQFARFLSMKQSPTMVGQPERFDPHAFIANMWVTAPNNRHDFYPKYPLGLPLIYAICLWIGRSAGPMLAFYVSPVAMAAAVFGVFLLVRHFVNSFAGVLGMLVFATSPTIAYLVNNPNSHAATIFCVVFGMIGVLHWIEHGGFRYAIIGGWLVGYAATIRYSEAALVLPLAWAFVLRLRAPWRRAIGEGIVLLLAWLMPIALLLSYNYMEMGTLTGYDTTNESSAFSWIYFYDNWETLLRQLSLNGLFLILPISFIGLIAMFWSDWRRAVFLALWVGPCLTTYTFYYWGPDGVNYLRFVVTVLPPLLIAAFWWMAHLSEHVPKRSFRVPLYAMILLLTLAGLATATLAYYGLRIDLPNHTLLSITDYMDQWPGTAQQASAQTTFIASVVVAGVCGAAITAAFLVGRSLAPTLLAGGIAFLSIAVQAENSVAALERESIDNGYIKVAQVAVQQVVPDGAVLISPDTSLLQYLQFMTNDLCYSGLSFDRGWVDSRPRTATDDPVLIDPVRNQQLFDALQGNDQNALNAQARQLVQDALKNKRRVFVVEQLQLPQMLTAIREKKPGPVPAFLSRYIVRPNDKTLIARRVTWWTVPPPPVNEPRSTNRGRRNIRGANARAVSNPTYQLWEITGG